MIELDAINGTCKRRNLTGRIEELGLVGTAGISIIEV